MNTALVDEIIRSLERTRACDLESQTLEFKSWAKDPRDLAREISEAAICLANSEGGLVIVGVDDKASSGAAIWPCPYREVTAQWARDKILTLTKPPVVCNVSRLGDAHTFDGNNAANDLLVIEVPKTTHPLGHRTLRGVSYIRANRDCRPEYLVNGDDFTAALFDHATYADFDEASVGNAVGMRIQKFPFAQNTGHRLRDHVVELGLVRVAQDPEDPGVPIFLSTIAGMLFLGREDRVKALMPEAATVVSVEASVISPLTSTNWYNVSDAVERYLALIQGELRKRQVSLSSNIIRELLLNAYLHRCYRTMGPIQIRITDTELEIRNPGGLLGDLTADNLLYTTPIYRNFLLADAARQFGVCEKAGQGIDKVYQEMVLDGLEFPIFESSANSFKAILRIRKDEAFARFIREQSGQLNLTLSELMVLRALRTLSHASTQSLSKIAQRPFAYTQDILVDLVRRGVVQPLRDDDTFRLSDGARQALSTYDDSRQIPLFPRG